MKFKTQGLEIDVIHNTIIQSDGDDYIEGEDLLEKYRKEITEIWGNEFKEYEKTQETIPKEPNVIYYVPEDIIDWLDIEKGYQVENIVKEVYDKFYNTETKKYYCECMEGSYIELTEEIKIKRLELLPEEK